MDELLWSLAIIFAMYLGAYAGLAVSFWRDRRAGRDPDWDRDW